MAATLHYPATRIRFSRAIAAELAALDAAEIGRAAAEATALVRDGHASPFFARRNAIATAQPHTGANRMYFDPHATLGLRDAIARNHNSSACRRLLARQDDDQPTDDHREVADPDPIEPSRAVVDSGDWSDWIDDNTLISRRDTLIGFGLLAALVGLLIGLGLAIGAQL